MGNERRLEIEFTGNHIPRAKFLNGMQMRVIEFVGCRPMTFDAFLREIAKNIWDHADGKGYLKLVTSDENSFGFEIGDHGQSSYDFEYCKRNSRLAGTLGNTANYGIGLQGIIPIIARTVGIEWQVDTTRGFHYKGVYLKNFQQPSLEE